MGGVTRGSRDNILPMRGVGSRANVRFSGLPNYSTCLGIPNSNDFATESRKDVLSSGRVSSGPHTLVFRLRLEACQLQHQTLYPRF